MLDKARLLKWLKDRTNVKFAVVGAVYAGLISRINRGEFDRKDE